MTAARVATIRELLTREFAPLELEVIDDSAAHIGHPGAASGAGHFRVRIVSARFAGLAPLARHRLVNACLGELMGSEIHALSIEAHAPQK